MRICASCAIPSTHVTAIFGEEWVKAQFDDDPRYVPDAYVGDETVGAMLTPSDRVTVELILAAEAKMIVPLLGEEGSA